MLVSSLGSDVGGTTNRHYVVATAYTSTDLQGFARVDAYAVIHGLVPGVELSPQLVELRLDDFEDCP